MRLAPRPRDPSSCSWGALWGLTARPGQFKVASRSLHNSAVRQWSSTLRRLQAETAQRQDRPLTFDPAVEVDHAEFLHEGRDRPRFKPEDQFPAKARPGEIDGVVREAVKDPWVGKLSPTSSHLFKLLIPLPKSIHRPSGTLTQTAFLLHPSQPLSHLSRLILGSLPAAERLTEVEFRAETVEDHTAYPSESASAEEVEEGEEEAEADSAGGPLLHERIEGGGAIQEVRWSPSTDLGDFIKQATISQSFRIVLTPAEESPKPEERRKLAKMNEYDETDSSESVGDADRHKHADEQVAQLPPLAERSANSEMKSGPAEQAGQRSTPDGSISIKIMIPSFSSRTVYLRKRLLQLTKEIKKQTDLKKELDRTAHKGARRIAITGLAGLVTYWGVVFKLTFMSSLGWDVMEPVTYLSGLTTVIGGYLFFLYHNREVSYSSVLDLSVSARQQNLYTQKGLDVEKWTEMVAEAKTLRKEISRIAADYDYDWKGQLQNLEATVPRKRADGMPAPTVQQVAQQNVQKEKEQQVEEIDDQDDLDVEGTINEAAELEEEDREKSRRGPGGRKGRTTEKMAKREEAGRDKGKKLVDENT